MLSITDLQKRIEQELVNFQNFNRFKENLPHATLELFSLLVELNKQLKKIQGNFDELDGTLEKTLKELRGKIDEKKGEKGNQGIQGLPGKQGFKGDKGDRGEKGSQGERGEQGERGIQGKAGKDGKNGNPGRDAKQETPKVIARKLETLKDEERLDYNALKNKPQLVQQIFGGGGGGGATIEPVFALEGTLDSVNADFTVAASRPNIRPNTEMVFLDGTLQSRDDDYTIALTPNSGTGVKATITFVTAKIPDRDGQLPKITYQSA